MIKINEKVEEKTIKTDYLYTTNNFSERTINFSKISRDKIEEYIELMKEHKINCVKAGNFIEAELAKQRVIQLKKILDKKLFKEALKRQNIVKKKFNGVKNKQIKNFKKEFNDKYAEEINKFEEELNNLKKKHEEELNNYFTNFENNMQKEQKPSNELIEKQKQLEFYIKTEE